MKETTSTRYESAVTFGRFNIAHKGHVELVQKMLQVADQAFVAVSAGAKNNDWDLRVLLFRALLRRSGVDLGRVKFVKQSNPFAAIETAIEATPHKEAVLVLGEDQRGMAEQLSADCDVPIILNRRTTSSTSVRANIGSVDAIYGDAHLAKLARALYFEELNREPQRKASGRLQKTP